MTEEQRKATIASLELHRQAATARAGQIMVDLADSTNFVAASDALNEARHYREMADGFREQINILSRGF